MIMDKECQNKKEIGDEKIKEMLTKSREVINKYIRDNPEILYKGIPIALAIYILSPTLFMAWEWLPWLWATYEIYNRIPEGTIPFAVKFTTFVFKQNSTTKK